MNKLLIGAALIVLAGCKLDAAGHAEREYRAMIASQSAHLDAQMAAMDSCTKRRSEREQRLGRIELYVFTCFTDPDKDVLEAYRDKTGAYYCIGDFETGDANKAKCFKRDTKQATPATPPHEPST